MNLTHLSIDTIEQINSIIDGPEDYGQGRLCSVCRYNEGPACWHHNVIEEEEDRPLLAVLEGGAQREKAAA